MRRHSIPTADYRVFRRRESSNSEEFLAAEQYIRDSWPVVVKASGLAGGKGAIVPDTVEDGVDAMKGMLLENKFGNAGEEIVIEEMLGGKELSVLAICDGEGI
jgi:phosphoribosylamine-glycine ligase